jgi:hypothetical protein
MISEPEARASLYHSLTSQAFTRDQFDLYLNTYLRQRAGGALPAGEDELAAFVAIMAEDYTEAQLIVRRMAPKNRAVLEFWAMELAGLVSHVQMAEDRYGS